MLRRAEELGWKVETAEQDGIHHVNLGTFLPGGEFRSFDFFYRNLDEFYGELRIRLNGFDPNLWVLDRLAELQLKNRTAARILVEFEDAEYVDKMLTELDQVVLEEMCYV